MKRLVLIDSHALIHRAYHALPPLTSAGGELVGAVYGFVSILLRVLRELKPDYIAAAYDLPGPTFRHVAYERYKAQRPETPSDLSSQFLKVKEVLDAFDIVVYQKEGYEADDLIGTIAKKLEKNKKIEIIILTGDQDILQLIGPRVKVYALKKGITETVTYDEKAVQERFGLTPGQLIDFKGLKGDASDNIPGVKGIGEKTALELLKKFGSVEGVYKALGKKNNFFSASLAEKLQAGEEDAAISKELARIKTDVAIDFDLEKTKWGGRLDTREIIEALKKFGFTSLLKRLDNVTTSHVVNKTGQEAFSFGEKLGGQKEPVTGGASIKASGMVLSGFLEKEVERPLTAILQKMQKRGILLDLDFLKKLAGQIIRKINGLKKEIYEFAGEEFNINSTRELSRILFEKLQIPAEGLRRTEKVRAVSTGASELEKLRKQHPIIQEILNYRELAKLQNTYIDVLPKLADKNGRVHTTFNQFGAATGRLSSSNPNLQNIPIMSEEGREIRKAFIAEEGYGLVFFDYSQIELRVAAHLADDKKMIEAFQQGEDIHKLTASEIYNVPLEKVTPDQRRAAKTLNFGILYGMGSQALAESTGMSRSDAKKFIDEYFRDFSGIKKFLDDTKKFVYENGYVETMFGRRRFIPEIFSSNWRVKREAERMAINMPIQGTATGDIIKIAMVKIDKWATENKLDNKVRMLLQVHDELVFEIQKEIFQKTYPKIKEIMENAAKLKVPIVVEVKSGPNWGEQKTVISY